MIPKWFLSLLNLLEAQIFNIYEVAEVIINYEYNKFKLITFQIIIIL